MTKNILAIAIAAAVMAPSAFAAATVYGNAHMSVGSSSDISNVTSTSQTNVTSNSSYLGVKGSEDLGAGLKAVYQYEMSVAFDGETANGSAASSVGSLRNSFVGLGGGFGTVLLGRHDSPIKMIGRKYDLFGDQLGNNRNILGAAGTSTHLVDGRHNNVIAYATPSFGGFSALLAYVPGADATSNGNENYSNTANKIDAFSANATYTAGGFDAGLGYITASNVLNTDKAFSSYRLGAGYTFGAARINAIYQNARYDAGTTEKDRGAYGLGASYKVTSAGTVKGQYMTADKTSGNSNNANMITVGYDHALTKNTTVYAVYAAVDNGNGTGTDGAVTAMMSNAGTNDNTTAIGGKDNSSMAVGVQHKF